MNAEPPVFVSSYLLATRKFPGHTYRPELSGLLENLADGSPCLHHQPPWKVITTMYLDKYTNQYTSHYASHTKGSHCTGVAAVIFRTCYCLWLCHLDSSEASASHQQPFRESPSGQPGSFPRLLPSPSSPDLVPEELDSSGLSPQVLCCVPHTLPLRSNCFICWNLTYGLPVSQYPFDDSVRMNKFHTNVIYSRILIQKTKIKNPANLIALAYSTPAYCVCVCVSTHRLKTKSSQSLNCLGHFDNPMWTSSSLSATGYQRSII